MMRKKQWIAGAFAATALVLGTIAGVISVKAADTEKTAKDVFVYSQIGRDDYTSCAASYSVILGSDDEKHYAVLADDGEFYEIDNSDGAYGNISVSSSRNYRNVLYSTDDNGKATLYNVDGTYAYGLDGNHEYVGAVYSNDSYIFYADGNDVVIKNKNGETVVQFTTEGTPTSIFKMNDYYEVYTSSGCKFFDKDGTRVDLYEKVAVEDYTVQNISTYGKYFEVLYLYDYDNTFDPIMGANFYRKFYNSDLTPYTDDLPMLYTSAVVTPDISEEDGTTVGNNSEKVFSSYYNGEDEGISLPDDYCLSHIGNIKGYTVAYASVWKSIDGVETYVEAVFDEDGNLLIDNPYDSDTFIGDKFVTEDKDADGNYKYTVKQVHLASSTKVTSTVTASDVDVNNLTDAAGNKITKDDLDADAKALLDQKFDFTLDADAGVVTDGATLSVSKLVSGTEYDAAKSAVQKVAEHMAVFTIDLLDSTQAKIQPNGELAITTDVPEGFDTERLAVYRLTADGYVKLDSKVADGKVTFQTDHFSTYLVAEMKEKQNVLYGDVNGDGEITLMDSALIRRYLAGWDVTIDAEIADVNGDEDVTLMDSALIRRYLAGWDVTLRQA